jgi:hypothetical protein
MPDRIAGGEGSAAVMMTILNEDGEVTVDGPAVALDDLAAATGWQLKPEGLCRGWVCVPASDLGALAVGGRISLDALASALHRPVVVDAEAGVAALGSDPVAVSDALRERVAVDFTLPQLDGTPFTFSSLGRKKKLLVAWASW